MDVDIITNSTGPKKFITNELLRRFAEGIKASGDTPHMVSSNLSKSKIAVIFGGSREDDVDNPRRILMNMHGKSKQIICLDGGFFRGTLDVIPDTNVHYRVALGNPTATGEFLGQIADSSRWDAFSSTFDIKLKPWRDGSPKQHIVVCTQSKGWSMNSVDSVELSKQWIREIREHTNRRIIVRPHPGVFTKYVLQKGKLGMPESYEELLSLLPDEYDYSEFKNVRVSIDFSKGDSIFKDLENAWAVVTYNSSACTDTIAAGIPTFMLSPIKTFGDGVCDTDLSKIEQPAFYEREQWAHDLCNMMYNLNEFSSGVPWRKFKQYLSSQ
jgi:hypothetical protein